MCVHTGGDRKTTGPDGTHGGGGVQTEKVIVRGNHGRVTAFCLKSVTKRSGFFNLEWNNGGEGRVGHN